MFHVFEKRQTEMNYLGLLPFNSVLFVFWKLRKVITPPLPSYSLIDFTIKIELLVLFSLSLSFSLSPFLSLLTHTHTHTPPPPTFYKWQFLTVLSHSAQYHQQNKGISLRFCQNFAADKCPPQRGEWETKEHDKNQAQFNDWPLYFKLISWLLLH